MPDTPEFDLREFLPYVLNIAAEEASLGFQAYYKERYGMLRTEWRVLFHIGRYGDMTAKVVSQRARLHKTKVSRAVAALEARRFVKRTTVAADRRQEMLSLTNQGKAAYEDLRSIAQSYDAQLASAFSRDEEKVLRRCLSRLAGLDRSINR